MKLNRFVLVVLLILGMQKGYSQGNLNRLALDGRQKALVAISALTARGYQEKLGIEMGRGLDQGLTINDIKETLVQLAAYTGFPRSLNAINTLKKVADVRKSKGITDNVGEEPLAMDTTLSRYELGKKNLEKLSGTVEKGKAGYAQYVPVIEVFLKEHLFADIFSRGVLSFQDRELITVSALSSLGRVEGQLQGHLGLSLHNGLTGGQLEQMLVIVGDLIGQPEAQAGTVVLKKVISSKGN